MDTKTEFKGKLSFIQDAIGSGHYDVAIKESCTLFEIIFRKIFTQALTSFEFKDRKELFEAEQQIGQGKKGVSEFGLGELVGLFRKTDLLDKWAKHSEKDLSLIKSENLNTITELRNRCVHEGESCESHEAEMVFAILKALLATIGYSNLEESISHSFTNPKETDNSNTDKQPSNKTAKVKRSNSYDPTSKNEKDRLAIQDALANKVDFDAFFLCI